MTGGILDEGGHLERLHRANGEMLDTMWRRATVDESCIFLDSALVGAQGSTISGC